MECSSERDMREVPGSRFPAITFNRRPHRTIPVFTLAGFITGAALANLIHKSAHRPFLVVAFMTVFAAAVELCLVFLDWLDLRHMRKEMAEQQEEMMRIAKAELTRLLPDDPIEVARLMMEMQSKVTQFSNAHLRTRR